MDRVPHDNPPPYSEAIKHPEQSEAFIGIPIQNPPGMSVPVFQNQYTNNPSGIGYMQAPTAPPPVVGFVPTYGTVGTTTTVVTPEIVIIGGCPSCRIGVLEDNYPLCAICCAVFFFPIGVLFCLAMRNKRCSNCGAEF